MTLRLQKQLQHLPFAPGVYEFLDAKRRVIYVGKAAVLKDRVRSYFRINADLAPMKQRMIADVCAIRIIPTDSEIEALLLEANLIKKLQPYYNVTLRDDKSYLYVKVSTEEAWPRVFATRKIEKAGTYFGPFTSANAVREVLRVLRKFLPYRCSQPPLAPPLQGGEGGGYQKGKACFWYHIGRCPGTCIGAVSRRTYAAIIRNIILFLRGRKKELVRAMRKDMGPDWVALMENVLAHTRILSLGEKYAGDVRELARVLHLPKPPERIEGYDISNIMGREAVGAMVVFKNGEPDKSEYKRFKIKTVHGANDVAMLEEVLTRRMRYSFRSRTSKSRSPASKDRWPTPDLIIVDGGKAQLNAAVRVLRRFQGGSRLRSNNISAVPIIAVAKGGHGGVLKQKEEIYFPGEKKPLKLPNASPALHLILRVRDEAHRFAIGYHKVLRKRKLFPLYNPTLPPLR